MNSSKCRLSAAWLSLMTLTAIGYAAAAKSPSAAMLPTLVALSAAAAKFSLVAWVFMDLRRVSRWWSLGLGTLLALILGMVALFQWGAFSR